MPRPVETLDIALPADHPLKRPVSSRNKQTAQRIYQLWGIWPWQLFSASSPHTPSIWTDNLLDKLKTIALCTTLAHARQLLDANLADGQALSISALNAVIDTCKEASDTPHNPVIRNRKRKRDRNIVVQHSDDQESDRGDSEFDQDLDQEEEEEDVGDQLETRLRRRRPPVSPTHRNRGNMLANGYVMPGKPRVPSTKRQKRRHHSTSTPLYLASATPPESTPTSYSTPRGRTRPSSSLPGFDLENARLPSSSDAVAAYIESVVDQLSSSFQEQCHGAEQAVEGARSQLHQVENRLASLEDELSAARKDIAEIEQHKSEMENTREGLLSIEKEEEELAARRRELITRRLSANWRPSSSMSSSSEYLQFQSPPSRTRASDEILTEIDALITDRLQPSKEREASLRADIECVKTEIFAARLQRDAAATSLNAKSDELIRWRGFSSDVQDALIRRGFADLTFDHDVDRGGRLRASLAPSRALSQTAAARSFPLETDHDLGMRAETAEPGPADSSELGHTPNLEKDKRYGSV
ncbi:hypothetical protein F4819DRAFT_122398 [Hypoxylon fuscum]|nr:hypothetical protein F4819DRAFT_122398 [Hypoxylon fuscum]